MRKLLAARRHGFRFLNESQRPDGSWIPLWFGNEHHPEETNPVYGTARVLLAYRDVHRMDSAPARRGISWLAEHRQPDGGWGAGVSACRGVSSVEETAVAVEALLAAEMTPSLQAVVEQGLSWLIEAVDSGRSRQRRSDRLVLRQTLVL